MTEVSIIVCTRNRPTSLERTLASIAHAIHNAPNIAVEVVVVNNASTDDTQSTIASWANQMPFPVKAIYESRKGLAIARNTGIAASEGLILAFTDDDCTLNTDFILRLRAHYVKDTEPVIRGGRVELGDPTDQPFSILLGAKTIRMNDVSFPGGFIIGANMTMHRSVCDRAGLFDARFGAGAVFMAGEETDYVYRAHRAGIPVEYVPDVIVKHFHGRKDKASIRHLASGYTLAEGALYAKHIRDVSLLRHFYWNCKKCVQGFISGDNFCDEVSERTYTTLILTTIKGMLLYWYHGLRGGQAFDDATNPKAAALSTTMPPLDGGAGQTTHRRS